MSSDLIDQHFEVKQATGPHWMQCNEGKWYARPHGQRFRGFLCVDGSVQMPIAKGNPRVLFDDYPDLEAAYQLWLKRQKEIAR